MSEYRALYRKWRSTDFDDVYGQSGITDILKYEVKENRLSHAYLFCGSRGTGKTSCAKILAKAVNCLDPRDGNPCNKCEACRSIDSGTATDVIEMDAASNNGVDNVRDIKDEIAFTPAILKYRVYIIDEVHMMSASAFNALLKTLEEPPSYVVFILATTEYHKLPTTIVSRCQRFDFKRISSEDIIRRLNKISLAEGIDLDADGARVIARIARGGMRDAISLLELCAGAHRKIDADLVFETVGSGNRDSAYKVVGAVLDADYSAVYSVIDDIVMKSGDISVFWQEIIDAYRDILIVKNAKNPRDYLDLTEAEYSVLTKMAQKVTLALTSYHISILEAAMSDMQRAINSKRSIAEIALTRMCDAKHGVSTEALLARVEALEKELSLIKLGVPVSSEEAKANIEKTVTVLPTKKERDAKEPEVVSEKPDTIGTPTARKTAIYEKWGTVVEKIGELKKSLSVGFLNSKTYVKPDGSFLIRMNPFFATKVANDSTDMMLVKGVIAESEGKSAKDIVIVIEPLDSAHNDDFSDEIEDAINNI